VSRRTRRGRALLRDLALLLAIALSPVPAVARQRPSPEGAAVQPEALPVHGVSPRGAFIRAMIVPGWGHVAIGSYTRGGFYFALETATAYTFLRTRHRLMDARERRALRESFLRESFGESGITDPSDIQARLDKDNTLKGLQALVNSRTGQQEDLLAWGIFMIFLTGADAYVSAHLAHFPAPIEIEAAPLDGGGAEVGLRLRLGP